MAQLYEKVDSDDSTLERKAIGGTPRFDSSGDKARWLKIEHTAQPPYDPSTQRLAQTREVLATKVKYDWSVIDLTPDEQRDTVDVAEDLAEALLAKGVLSKADLRGRFGR